MGPRVVAVFLLVALCAACFGATDDNATQTHPEDVERSEVAPCLADAPLVSLRELRSGDIKPGTRVAVEGSPVGRHGCTKRRCYSACCNHCGIDGHYELGDYYAREDAELELRSDDFRCGGMDCSSYCAPLGLHPQGRYRFIGEVTGDRESWQMQVTVWCRIK